MIDPVLDHVQKNPGALCVHIAKALGLSVAETGARLKALRAEGKVKSEGRTRGTRWTAV